MNNIKRPTPREVEILLCMAEGLASKQIAERLNISEYTVDTHKKNLFEKFQAKNSNELLCKYNKFSETNNTDK